MAKIIQFPKFKIGEILEIEYKNKTFKIKILEHVSADIYRIKALNGPYKGQVSNLHISKWDTDFDEDM